MIIFKSTGEKTKILEKVNNVLKCIPETSAVADVYESI